WPCRASSIALIVVFAVLFFTDAAQDLLYTLSSQGLASAGAWSLIIGTAMFGWYVWFWSMRTLALRFRCERQVLIDYRTQYPAKGHKRNPKTQAENRADRILLWRRLLPSFLSALAHIIVGVAVLWTIWSGMLPDLDSVYWVAAVILG